MYYDLVHRQARDVGNGLPCTAHHLGPDPNVAAILANMQRTVHRLHSRMREDRQAVDIFEDGPVFGLGLGYIAFLYVGQGIAADGVFWTLLQT